MNIPLPTAAFPIGHKGGAATAFVVAVLVGLAIYMAQTNQQQPPTR